MTLAATAGAGPEAQVQALPPLRDDLDLLRGTPTVDGAPTWTLYDRTRHRYFSLGRTEFELLRRWARGPVTAAGLIEQVQGETGIAVDEGRVTRLQQFLLREQLLRLDGATLKALAARAYRSPLTRLLHGYLFFRIPLWHPDQFLERTMPWVEWVFSPRMPWVLGLVALLGLYLVSRQWDAFLATFPDFFSLGGALTLAGSLFLAKVLHELGHAYTAKHFGLRVSTIGLAVIVLWPVLYTDTSDAWRLTSRRRRLLVGAAGMIAEVSLAVVATLLWSFTPDGPLRGALFTLAAASWLISLAINLNPWMRYDGYYLLSDLLGVPNLQQRAFKLGRWRLREALFGFGDPPPEGVAPRRRRALLIYAYTTWIYRAVLFLGIALLVYHLFFKVLGIFLMAVEIIWFVALPVYRELAEWRRRSPDLRWNRHTLRTTLVTGLILVALIVPWRSTLHLPAMYRVERFQSLFAPSPARLAEARVRPGQVVAAGEVLFRFEDPEIAHELEQQRREERFALLELSLQAGDRAHLEQRLVLEERLARAHSEGRRQEERLARLVVTAPFAGRVASVAEGMTPGRWVEPTEELAYLVQPGTAEVTAYLDEEDLDRVAVGDEGRFYPEDPALPPLDLTLRAADPAPLQQFARNDYYVASPFHGEIAARKAADGAVTPEAAVYRLRLTLSAAPLPADQAVRGNVTLEVRSSAGILERGLRRAWAVLIRESGF